MDKRTFLESAGVSAAAAVLVGAGRAQAQPAGGIGVLIAYHSMSGNTEKMAQGVADGVKSVASAKAVLKRVGEVTADDLLSAQAVIIGSPVYFANVTGEVKTFLDNWFAKFDLFRGARMRNKIGAAFATGASISNGKETTMLAILQAMLVNQMIVVGGGGAFGASATTGPDSPGIDDKELDTAKALGKRVAEVAASMRTG